MGPETWRGWWGEEPPYHVPVFVLTHHAREPLEMQGGTTFHFVTDGIESALEQARAAAGEQDVTIAGGAKAVQQYLAAGLLDELYLHIVPVILGGGERLLENVGDPRLGAGEGGPPRRPVTHVKYRGRPLSAFAGLEPAGFWRHLEALIAIPRPSHEEDAAVAHVVGWAGARGYATRRDGAGNLVVQVPATPGREGAPTVILQGHLDIVCERDPASPYDPRAGRIHVVRDGDWLRADGTTLGADNGVAIAAMMALAESDAPHGPLELLMTVAEEVGMAGAAELDPALIGGGVLLNLDSEEDATLTVGCAGGADTFVRLEAPREPVGADALRVTVSGGRGGHSGGDIAAGRSNAIKLLARALSGAPGVRIASLDGGSSRNAIPRDAVAVVVGDGDAIARAGARRGGRVREDRPGRARRRRAGGRRRARRVDRGGERPHPRPRRRDPARAARHERRLPRRRRDEQLALRRGHERRPPRAHLPEPQRQRRPDRETSPARSPPPRGSPARKPRPGRRYPGWLPDLGSPALATAKAVHERLFGAAAAREPHPRRPRDRGHRRPQARPRHDLVRAADRRSARAGRAPARRLGGALHAAARGARRRAVALTNSSNTRSIAASSFHASCSSHCTPSTHASPSTSTASTSPSSAHATATTPSPSRSTAWWWYEFDPRLLRPQRGGQARAGRDAQRVARVRGHVGLVDDRPHHEPPAVPVAARVRRGVADQRPAARHVEQLHPAADPEHRQPARERPARQLQLELVAVARVRRHLRVRLAAVARRVDVGAEPEHDAVGRVQDRVHVAQERQLHRQRAGRLERPRVRQPHVVAVRREPGGDGDQRAHQLQG